MGDYAVSQTNVWGAYLRSRGFDRDMISNSCPDCYTVADFAAEHPHGSISWPCPAMWCACKTEIGSTPGTAVGRYRFTIGIRRDKRCHINMCPAISVPYQPPMPDQLAQLRGAQYQHAQQMPQAQPQQVQAGGQSMVWVSGESEAMAYLVAPNSAVALWDSNAPTIYLKQADASGKPSIKVYDLVERTSGARTAQSPRV